MVDKPGKYAAALAAINQPEAKAPAVLLPLKTLPPSGKRSTPGWKQKAVLLQEETVKQAHRKLRLRGDRTDFSDLMQALLEAWLKESS